MLAALSLVAFKTEEKFMKDNRVAVIGLGYVGLTLATVMAEKEFQVVGIEKRQDLVEKTNAGIPHFSEDGLREALERVVTSSQMKALRTLNGEDPFNVYIITVGTPLNSDGNPVFDFIKNATEEVARHMADDALVILRSTVALETSRNFVVPILKKSGKRFDIAMCPERTLEGNALEELLRLPQIIGADQECVRNRAAEIFSRLTKTVVKVSSLETAEMIKLVDNTSRDVNFAFANEVARACEAFGVKASEVISLGAVGYERTKVSSPGLVGGPCLEKDPHILLKSAESRGVDLEITRSSRLVNERQPLETVGFIVNQMKQRNMGKAVKVTILGMAFKGRPITDDLRGSMSLKVLDTLNQLRPDVSVHAYDPVISPAVLSQHVPGIIAHDTLDEAIKCASVVIIGNNHPMFEKIMLTEWLEIMRVDGFVYDYWNNLKKNYPKSCDDKYFVLGDSGRIGI
jgi:UDP-N-acetyl-D-mannosaminuronic acid dehydrogenase